LGNHPVGRTVSAQFKPRCLGACLTNDRLLRPARSGMFLRSFRLHSAHYARETIAKICSLGAVLATAIIGQTGSCATQS
jgi:hypothetical protein